MNGSKKSVITDVMGILLENGQPMVSETVIQTFVQLEQQGISVITCTANSYYSIQSIIEKANIQSPQICDAGRTIIYPKKNTMLTMPIGSRKADAVRFLIQKESLFTPHSLGIGDSGSDIDFMKLCGFVGTVTTATQEVKDFVSRQHGYISDRTVAFAFTDICTHFFKL